ncbi:hypothetical protein [Chryseobacterium sp.]|uniref:FEKKY domain-containing protein n=1 Tax=Chryseobacterium sp. TaxID=1871047 RepID=UPI00388D4880
MKKQNIITIIILFSAVTFTSAQKNKENSRVNTPTTVEKTKEQELIGYFIDFGIVLKSNTEFIKKYKIGIKSQGCVITESSSKAAKSNNQQLADLLDKKYGDIWKKDLGFVPYGL